MKRYQIAAVIIFLPLFLISCAIYPPERYNTRRGAFIGAGAGALIGQAIGGDTESTLIGLAAGTILGALVGNAVDQDYQAVKDAALYQRPVLYYDKDGRAVEAIPEGTNSPNCKKVRKRVWEDGKLVKETVEEICDYPAVATPYYYAPPLPPPSYYDDCYGWWGWPFVPSVTFYFGGSHHNGYYIHGPYHYHYGRHHR
ncbi:membrane hypothetical protein [uncultured Desulfobacterium sp.]|uniref:Glycine zipper domain-containing protein n=1 Tax=uncultured Desulfobacterium sp. TaxID=201089 RepID=A0A445MY65_9BACT|nr:membrane hypothetical protein [uncultured Desulfobacterium sp.]